MRGWATIFSCLLFIATGCATSPDEMSSAYVSPLIYKNYDCDQLIMESDRISRRVQSMHAKLDQRADDDAAKMTIGLILFWPTLFFLDGDSDGVIEYKRLKGESEAVHQAAVAGKCDLRLLAPMKPIENKKEKLIEQSKKDDNCTNTGEDCN